MMDNHQLFKYWALEHARSFRLIEEYRRLGLAAHHFTVLFGNQAHAHRSMKFYREEIQKCKN